MDIDSFLNQSPWGGYKWACALEKRLQNPIYLESHGYKVYSQNDEDGILQEIFRRIGTATKTFVEFGVENGIESNGHSLLLQGWRGTWIECDECAYEQILRRFAPVIRQGRLQVLNRILNRDNINAILTPCVSDELDLLCIDVDGNDWHIWNAVQCSPRVVVIEYNGTFAPEIDWKMAYNEHHIWDGTDYFGASLKALERLGDNKGYQLVGTSIAGVNAFFVRKDLCKDKFPIPATAENLYNPLRLNMIPHKNGHGGKNYVGNDIEGMEGLFQYYPNWNRLASFGFYPVEVHNGMPQNRMKEKNAQIFISFIPETAIVLRLSYTSESCIECLSSVKLKIQIGNMHEKEFILKDNHGYIDIQLEKKYHMNDIIALNIKIDSLWQPSLLTDGVDKRIQGICITDIAYI